MTQDEFFGAVEHNLRQLAKGRGELPSYNIPRSGSIFGKIGSLKWLSRVKGFRQVSKNDSSCPPNVRCYDLFSSKMLFASRIVFRVFACYADEPTRAGYRNAKRAIRRWYQLSGRAASTEQPYAAALVVGAGMPWGTDVTPNADDMPCENVAFRMLAASCSQTDGVRIVKEGDVASCLTVYRALVPETFDNVERRVRNTVEGLIMPDGCSVVGGGYLTVRKVMDKLPMIPFDVVANIFNKMQSEGTHSIGKLPRAEGRESPESRMYIEKRPPSSWRRMLSKGESEWYTQSKLCRLVSLGTLGSLLSLPFWFAQKIVPDMVFANRWVFFFACCGLLGLCLSLWLWGFLRRRL